MLPFGLTLFTYTAVYVKNYFVTLQCVVDWFWIVHTLMVSEWMKPKLGDAVSNLL